MFAKRIRELRLARNLTQFELANLLGLRSASTVTMWEKGQRKPDSSMLIQIAKFFQCSVDYLLGIKDD